MADKTKNKISILGIAMAFTVTLGLIFGIVISLMVGQWQPVLAFVIYSVLLTLIVKAVLDMSVKKLLKRFSKEMDAIKQGDFSHLVDSKSYGVLGELSSTVNAVLSDIRILIDGFFTLSLSIIQASRKVSGTASEASTAMEEISKTVDEIAKGASSQAQEAQQGVEMVEKLSEQINFVYESYNGVTKETDKIATLNKTGLESVNTLREKSEENNNTSEKIFSVVKKLTDTTKDIGQFVESIENIAEQTNLLALNASIEAARAGDAGKGFVVVAEEVRKLADESRKSTEEITNLMESIQQESLLAIEAMDAMKKVSKEQNLAVNRTNSAFNDIANGITVIIEKINAVNASISKMQDDKNEVISSIENISSVSEETAASSQEVAATTEHQLKAIDDMKVAAHDLDNLVQELDKKLKKYKLR